MCCVKYSSYRYNYIGHVSHAINPLPSIRNNLKQKSLYKVLMPSIKPHINSYGLMGAHDAYMRHWLVKS